MRTLWVSAVIVVAGLVLTACSTAPRQPDPQPFTAVPSTPAIRAERPVASASGSHAADLNGKLGALGRSEETGDLPLGAGDLIEVSVFDVPELSQIKVRIPNSGQVSLPLIGGVTATGLTAVQLQAGIADQLKAKLMHDPQVQHAYLGIQ